MSTTILLFRQDLRLHDHPALTAAAQRGDVLPVFIYDEQVAGEWGFGAASQWWLHESLTSLSASIESLGGHLLLLHADGRRKGVAHGVAGRVHLLRAAARHRRRERRRRAPPVGVTRMGRGWCR